MASKADRIARKKLILKELNEIESLEKIEAEQAFQDRRVLIEGNTLFLLQFTTHVSDNVDHVNDKCSRGPHECPRCSLVEANSTGYWDENYDLVISIVRRHNG